MKTEGLELNSDNYYHWEYNMRMKLSRKGLVQHLCSDADLDHRGINHNNNQWLLNDLKALGLIASSVGLAHQVHIRDAATARAAWEALLAHFNRNTLKNRVHLLKKMHAFKMEEGRSIQLKGKD